MFGRELDPTVFSRRGSLGIIRATSEVPHPEHPCGWPEVTVLSTQSLHAGLLAPTGSYYLRVSVGQVSHHNLEASGNLEWRWLGISPALLLARSAVSEDGLAQGLSFELTHVAKENLPFHTCGLSMELFTILFFPLSEGRGWAHCLSQLLDLANGVTFPELLLYFLCDK